MKVITANQLAAGSIIMRVEGNPNIRGTVTEVHQFCNSEANRLTDHRDTIAANHRGVTLALTSIGSRTLRVKSPPSSGEARAAAAAVEACYDDNPPTSIAVRIGYQRISLRPDTKVQVWVPATEAIFAFNPTR